MYQHRDLKVTSKDCLSNVGTKRSLYPEIGYVGYVEKPAIAKFAFDGDREGDVSFPATLTEAPWPSLTLDCSCSAYNENRSRS